VPESIQSSEERSEDEEARQIQPQDDATNEILEQALGNDIVRKLLSHVPDERQHRIFILKGMEGLT
jgi:hypothetical protein